MGFSLSTLSSFTLEDSGILIQKAVLGADLVDYIDVRPGYPEATVAVNVLGGTADFQNSSCGWTSGGSTNFTQISITNSAKSWKQSLCLEDLRAYWLSTQLDSSAYGENLPFEEAISNYMVEESRKAAEAVIGSQIISQVTVSNGASQGATAAFTSSTAYAKALQMIDALPLSVANRDDLMMFMSYASFRALMTNLVALNLYHYAPGVTTGTGLGQSVVIPGTNITAIPVGGFGTSNRVICGPAKHIIMVCGLVEDTDRIDAWWSRDNQEMRLIAKFTNGVGVLVEEFSTNDLA
jgi:hypothetical protein